MFTLTLDTYLSLCMAFKHSPRLDFPNQILCLLVIFGTGAACILSANESMAYTNIVHYERLNLTVTTRIYIVELQQNLFS